MSHPMTEETIRGAQMRLSSKDPKLGIGKYVGVSYQPARHGRIIGISVKQAGHQPPYAVYSIRAINGSIFEEHVEYLYLAIPPKPQVIT